MHATIQCICGKHLDADAQRSGDRAQCPACGNVFVIGAPLQTTAIQADPSPIQVKQAAPTLMVAPLPNHPSIEKPRESSRLEMLLLVGVILAIPTTIFGIGCLCIRPMGGGSGQADLAYAQAKGTLTNACETFRIKNGRLPKGLTELLERNDDGGPYLENPDALIDPWGSRYQYDINGPMNNGVKPDIWTVNPSNGAKIGNWPRR